MSIRFYLIDNPLTPDPKDCRAQVVSNGTKTLDDAIEMALKRGTLVTKTDLKAVSEILYDVLIDFVAQGYNVITPLEKIRITIKGNFDGKNAAFDSSTHQVRASHSSGTRLQEMLAKVEVEKVKRTMNDPDFGRLMDEASGMYDSEITPGGMALLIGDMFLFDSADADQGLFFVAADKTETKVTRFLETMPKKISFMVPPTLVPGTYDLVMRTRFYGEKLRTGTMPELVVK